MIDVVMPQLGESVAEGTVTKWLVAEGDYVKRDQPLLEVATDKADSEIPAPVAGKVVRIAVAPGTVVATKGLLCQIDETAHAPLRTDEPCGNTEALCEDRPPALRRSVRTPQNGDGGAGPSPLTSPSTRKLAQEMGVDLKSVQATGEHGRVTRDDLTRAVAPATPAYGMSPTQGPPPPSAVFRAPSSCARSLLPLLLPLQAAAPAAVELSQLVQAGGGFVPPIPGVGFGAYKVPPYVQKPGDEIVPFSRRRRITADHMVYSKIASPHVVTVAEVDLYATSKLRDEHKDAYKKDGVSLTFLAFISAAVVKALGEHPQVNSRVLESSVALIRDVNLGIAVETPGGLIVPSIKHADQLSLRGIAAGIDELATRARAGKTTADDLAGTTFTVSNPGTKGNLFGAAIISQPNVGILRMGEIKKRVVVVSKDGEDAMAIHPVMFMALSYDHRVVDGVLANSFLWRIGDILSRGEFEL